MADDAILVEIDLKSISIQRALFQEPDRSTEEYSSATLGLLPTMEVEKSRKRVQVKLIVQAFLEKAEGQEEDRIVVGILDVSFIYDVKGLEGLHGTETQIRVPNSLTARLLHDAYLTARGIWYSKTIGMRANDAILPVRDPKELLEALNTIQTSTD